MANGHGGARPGAGRKRDPQVAKLRALITTVMSDDDWIKIFNGVVDDARSGDLRSVSFLLALGYGVSTKSLVAAEEADLNPAPAEEADLNPAPGDMRPQVGPPAQPVIRRVQTR
jgi:hypothetical protein